MAEFEFEGFDELIDAFNLVRKNYPKDVKKFMQSEGTKLKNRTVKTAKSSVKQHTGNLAKGIKRGKYYKYSGNGADAIRVYAGSPAYHAHLLEYGHELVSHNHDHIGEVKAYHIFKKAADDYESTFEKDSEKFADKIAKQLE